MFSLASTATWYVPILFDHVPVGSYAVGADDNLLHLAPAQKRPRRRIGDDRDGNALPGKFPGGELRPLAPRSRFVRQNGNPLALLPGGPYHSQGGAVSCRRQGSRVAVGEDHVAVLYEVRPVSSMRLLILYIFAEDGEGFRFHLLRNDRRGRWAFSSIRRSIRCRAQKKVDRRRAG